MLLDKGLGKRDLGLNRNRRIKNHSMIGLQYTSMPNPVKIVKRPQQVYDLVLRPSGRYPSEHRHS